MARRFQFAGGLAALALLAAAWLAFRSSAGSAPGVAAPPAVGQRASADEAGLALRRPGGQPIASALPARPSEGVSLETAPASSRQPVEIAEPNLALVHGQVVDSRTGQGLPCVEVATYAYGEKAGRGEVSDLEGRIAVDTHGGEHDFVFARDRARGRVRMARHKLQTLGTSSGAQPGFVWPLEVGPTLVVQLRGAPRDLEGWRVRILERPTESEERDWEWCDPVQLEAEGLLVARYKQYATPPEAGHPAWIQVAESSETWKGELEIDSTLGVHAVAIEVEAVAARLDGRVVDERGRPVQATVIALRRGVRRAPDTEWPQVHTDEAGAWHLIGLEAGATRLLVLTDHRPAQRVDLELERGASRDVEIVVAPLAPAGPIRGALVAPEAGNDPSGIVRLESIDGGSTNFAAFCFELDFFGKSTPDGRAAFEFGEVPAGRYRLSVLPIDGRRYEPESIEVVAPAEVEFRTEELEASSRGRTYELLLCDAKSGARLSEASLLFHLDPFWSSEVEQDDAFQELLELGEHAPASLVVSRPGYRPAFLYLPGAFRSARREGDLVQVRLDLQPGWGAALIVVDAEQSLCGDDVMQSSILSMRGLAGARVVANGRVVGTSDARGLALCASDGPIEEFEVELAGWTVLACDRFRGHTETPDGLGFVLMARD